MMYNHAMRSDAPRQAPQRLRLLYVSPLQLGLLALVNVVCVYLALCACSFVSWSWVQLAISAVAGFVGGALQAVLFDIVAPRFGGLKIELVAEHPPRAPMVNLPI